LAHILCQTSFSTAYNIALAAAVRFLVYPLTTDWRLGQKRKTPENAKTDPGEAGLFSWSNGASLGCDQERHRSYESGTQPPLTVLLHYAQMGYLSVESLIDDKLKRVWVSTRKRSK